MKAVSARFLATCAGPHQVVATVDVYEAGVLVAPNVRCVDGTVTLDRTAAVFGRFSGTFVGLDRALIDRLVKNRCELRITRGVAFVPAAETETFPLGRFLVTEVRQDLSSFAVEIDSMDVSYLVSQRRLNAEYEAVAGTPVGDHIEAILSSALGYDAPCNFPSTPDQAVTTVVGTGDDPLNAAREMAEAVGFDLHVDATGSFVLVLAPSTVPGAPVTWTIDRGIVSGSVGWSYTAGYETVEVVGTNPASTDVFTGTTAVEWVEHINYLGSLGRKLMIYDSNIGSDTQAQEAAEAAQRLREGSVRTVDLSGWWPYAEPGDLVRIVNDAPGMVLDEVRVLDQVTIPLLGTVRLGTRQDDLVAMLRPAQSGLTPEWVEGVVTSTSPFKVDGAAAVKLDSYTPTLADKVQLHVSSGRRLVVGKVA